MEVIEQAQTLRERIDDLMTKCQFAGMSRRATADSILSLILSEIDKGKLTPKQIQQCEDNFREDCDFYFSDPAHDLDDPEAPRNVLDYVAAAQLEAIKKQLRG